MPFVPLIIAAVSIAGAAGTIGGLVAGTLTLGTLSIGAAAGLIGAVGATIGAVGAVTGNKALKTAGLVIGGIGAIGGLANAVGAFGENATMASVFGGEAASAGEASTLGTGANIGGNISETTGLDVNAAVGGGDVVNTANTMANSSSYFESSPWLAPAADAGTGVESATVTASRLAPEVGGEASTLASAAAATAAVKNTSAGEGSGEDVTKKYDEEAGDTTDAGTPSSAINPETKAPAEIGDVYTNPRSGISSVWNGTKWDLQPAGGMTGFLKSAGGAALVVGGLNMVSGMMDPTTDAKVAELESTAHANEATAALTNKRVSNMNDVLPTARRVPVTGRPGGLINNSLATGAMT